MTPDVNDTMLELNQSITSGEKSLVQRVESLVKLGRCVRLTRARATVATAG